MEGVLYQRVLGSSLSAPAVKLRYCLTKQLKFPSHFHLHTYLSRAVSVRAATSGAESGGIPRSHKLNAASAAALEQLRSSSVNRYTSEKSSIMVIGLSVHTAPVEMREKLAVPEAEWPNAIGELCSLPHIEEAAVLSTCNRLEIYVVALSWHRGVREVMEWMAKRSSINLEDLRSHLYLLREKDASLHLLRVASGLDSLVLGEGQILSQVKQVATVGQGAIGFGRNLNGLFKQAITCGKRVRTETNICQGAVSVSSAAVELAALRLWPTIGLPNAGVVIVGAGKMSKLLVKHLLSKGVTRMVVVNRSEGRVADLQAEFPEAVLRFEPLSRMHECCGEAELVFTSTASESPLFFKEDVERMSRVSEANGGVRHFVDISVPRNIGGCVAELPHARLYNVDDLKEVVAANQEERRRKALEAQTLIDEELLAFDAWRDSLETVPTIKKLRQKVEDIRMAELDKCLVKLGDDVTKKNRKLVDDLSRGLVNKILHGPMTHLRSDGSDARTVSETIANMQALERMFDLLPAGSSQPEARR